MADALGTPGGVVSAIDHRLALAGLVAPQTSSLAVRTGVLWGPGTTALVTGTSATGTMTYAIALHHAVTTRGTADGVYLGPNLEAATTVATTAAPGANSRIDIIWSKQNDTSSTVSADSGSTAPLYGVANGTAAASPVAPSIPVGAIELARATVATGATSTNGAGVTITNTAQQTVARGADIPVRNQTERDALTPFWPLLTVKRLDTGAIEMRNAANSAWLTVYDPSPAPWPVATLRQSAAQTGLASGWNSILMQAEDIDTAGGHSTSTNTSRYTVPSGQGGTYVAEGGVAFASTGSPGLLAMAGLAVNGVRITAPTGAFGTSTSTTSAVGAVTGSRPLALSAGDYVEVHGHVNGAGWATAVGPDAASWLSIYRIR